MATVACYFWLIAAEEGAFGLYSSVDQLYQGTHSQPLHTCSYSSAMIHSALQLNPISSHLRTLTAIHAAMKIVPIRTEGSDFGQLQWPLDWLNRDS